jgi:hypothetical protein
MKHLIGLVLVALLVVGTRCQFMPMSQYITEKLCNYDTECIANQRIPDDNIHLSEIEVGGKKMTVVTDINDPDMTILSCPSTMLPTEEDITLCAIYMDRRGISTCTSRFVPQCRTNLRIVPPCCR